MNHGRCFTLLTPTDIKIYKIKWIEMILHVNSTIIIHTPGMFVKGNDGGQKKLDIPIELGKYYEYSLDSEYHQLLDVDYGGFPCKKEPKYQKDLCTAKSMEKEMLDKVGCTIPSQQISDKLKICQQKDDGNRAMMDIYWRDIKEETDYGCSNPCSIFSFTSAKS